MTLAAPPRKGHAERAWHALRTDPWTLVALAALAFLAVFVVLPLFELLRQSVIGQESGRFGLENFVTFFESRYFRRALGNSFLVATLGTVLALMIGLPLAFVFARYDFPAKRWIEVAILMSMLSPPFVGAYAWILMFGRSGIVTEAGRSIGLELPTIYGPVGIAIASAFGLYPLVFLVVRGALSRVSATIEEAAASLGRSPFYVVWSVTLPLVIPAVVTSALLVFLGIISDFGTPAILGEGERYPVLATLAFSLYLSEIGAETGMAATTSMILVGLALALVLVARFLATRRLVANDGASSRSPEPLPARTAWVMAAGVAALVLIANMPLFVVVISSFLEVRGVVFQPALTLDNYTKAFGALGNALTNSLIYASVALALTIVAGTALGYYVSRRSGPLARILDLLIMIPYVVPGTVLGIGYAQVFNGPPLFLTGTAGIIAMVYFVRKLPYMMRASSSIVYQIDRNLEDASLNLGVPPGQGFFRIMVPLMRPGVLAGASIAWVEIFNELSASIVLYTGATRTLPIAAYQQSLGGDVGMAAAYATMLIVVTAAALTLFMLASRGQKEKGLGLL
ncbi:MAG: iron ABC transporter permease [Hyphomicrobiales bacterium]|nr:iron ABC transporter permease [Hyphomicrobiales bacterium]